MADDQPKIFIASSSKSLKYAGEVKNYLDKKQNYSSIVWDKLDNYPSTNINDWVTNLSKNFDFGIFIFYTDDNTAIGSDEKSAVVRDNVLFELGLFTGYLGLERCYILSADDKALHLPSDLEGILRYPFKKADEFNTITDVLNIPCEKIATNIDKRWKDILEARRLKTLPEKVAAICYRMNDQKKLYEFLLVRSSDDNRFGFPKCDYDKSKFPNPLDAAIDIARIEGNIQAEQVAKAPQFLPFKYKKEKENAIVNFTPYLLKWVGDLPKSGEIKDRSPQFFELGEVFTQLRSNRNDPQSVNSLERVICQCYEFLLRD